MADPNPFFAPSTLPYGLPPFADIRFEHFRPAFERGFAEQLAEIAAITSNPDDPTAENTLVPLERSGCTLHRVATVFFTKTATDSDPASDELETELAPLLAAHADAIRLDAALFARVLAVDEAAAHGGADRLDPETARLAERTRVEMTLAGAALSDDDKTILRDYNSRLSSLTTRFEKNLLADTNSLAVHVTDVADLDGLDDSQVAATAQAARDRGLDGFVITLVLPTGHPYLASLTVRSTRERLMTASRSRGVRGGRFDNRTLVLEIARIRAERATLLGFENHAALVTADETAKTPENVAAMLERLAPAAARNARLEKDVLRDHAPHDIEAWDWAFVTERVRAATYDLDVAALRPYFEAERVLRDGVFFAATRLYGVTFAERHDLQSYHPGSRIFEVHDDDGSPVGLYALDLYTRDSKRGGAWMNSLVSQSALLDLPVVVTNNLNVPKPPEGAPTLLTLDEVTTVFHEFGHALHGLFARVTYPSFSGTSVGRDFVEYPSQVNEMWKLWPEVLANYAVHVDTGEPLPADVVDRLRSSGRFNEGFATSEYLAAAMLDQAWHTLTPADFTGPDAVTDVEAFEAAALARFGLDDPAVPPRYSSTYFAHIFSGGYSAAYYSYIWSEVLDAESVLWFEENGGLTRANGDRFRSRLLGVGGSRDPLDSFRDFRGRDATIEPLLDRRGLG
ncbi:M3 family metallopeptidase [Marisediminicola sp. LYQ134]|uniref:M3 family metallopeptidase n=1 Tax=unclassified Marisediminicola TaxID=2618316 RepID=UPI003982DE89